jgi:D-alanyl-D-alanine carboxypeptidase (penicillin-binding protein 5/6)
MLDVKMNNKFKKVLLTTGSSALLLSGILATPQATVEAAAPDVDAEASITVDYDTGQILQGKEIDEPLGIASMTKMIAEYIVFEEIEAGTIDWDTQITISDYAYEISQDYALSNVPLRNGENYSLRELYEAMAIYSANGATIAIAEHISGSEPEFVDRMKETVESFGIKDATLVNSTGLNNSDLRGNTYPGSSETDENMMSARSAAKIANRIVTDYPEILETSSIPRATFREGTVDEVLMTNWNWMLEDLILERPGVSGLKTGTTNFAGATFTGTAAEDDRRLITVVLNSGDDKTTRFTETDRMLDYGFNEWALENVTDQWDEVLEYEPLPVTNGQEEVVNYAPSESLELLVENGTNLAEDISYALQWNPDIIKEDGSIQAPITEGMELGQLVINYEGNEHGYLDEEEVASVPLVTTEAVEQLGFFGQAWSWVKSFFGSIASRF